MARLTSRSAVLAIFFAALPLPALAADTGGSVVSPPSSVAAPLTLGGAAEVPTTSAPSAQATPPAQAGKTGGAQDAKTLLASARSLIAAKKWTDALVVLKAAAVVAPKDADVQNLLGYATRNNGDVKGSLVFYNAALALNPVHIGALEYQGVAYIKLGQTAKARANLAKLKTICGVSCGEYKDLAAALKVSKKK